LGPQDCGKQNGAEQGASNSRRNGSPPRLARQVSQNRVHNTSHFPAALIRIIVRDDA
jgi:hypothetical protein